MALKIFLKAAQDTFTHSWITCLGCSEGAALMADLAGQAAGEKSCPLSVTLPTDVVFDGTTVNWLANRTLLHTQSLKKKLKGK